MISNIATGVFLMLLFASNAMSASEYDTLRFFDPKSASAFYRDPSVVAQGARFDIAAPGYLRSLVLWLGGSATHGSATVTIYGHASGIPAPMRGEPIAGPFTIQKSRRGVEKIHLSLPDDLYLEYPQFFVVVEKLSSGMALLSDRRQKKVRCESIPDRWQYQVLKKRDGMWYNGSYGFAIEAAIEYPHVASPSYLADVSDDAGFKDFKPPTNKCIAWGDIDSDGWSDVLVGTKLFRNLGGEPFDDISKSLGSIDSARAHVFIDGDNDGDLDILILAARDDKHNVINELLINDGHAGFTSVLLDLPRVVNPTAVVIADADLDHYLDVFIGQGVDSKNNPLPSLLLLNTGRKGFVVDSTTLVTGSVVGAQWIDVDRDGDPDLYTSGRSTVENALWLNDGHGAFAHQSIGDIVASDSSTFASTKNATGDWADVNGDGSLDLLQPSTVSTDLLASETDFPSLVFAGQKERGAQLDPVDNPSGFAYTHWSGGGTLADVDNSGTLDMLITSACDCRYASLYLRDPVGHLVNSSFEYGLFRTAAGSDAVWIDYNNDGKLDLATFVKGKFRLFRNTLHTSNNFIDIDLTGAPDPAALAGGKITAYMGELVIDGEVVLGRGSLMQAPLRMHFGLGDKGRVDSIVIRGGDNNGGRRTIANPEVNRLYRLVEEKELRATVSATDVDLRVSPNPFTGVLTFRYRLPSSMRVRIEVHSLDGKLASVPFEGMKGAGAQSFEWTAIDGDGNRLAPGIYIYRVQFGTTQLVGRATLIH